MRGVGVVVLWLCLGLGVTDLIAQAIERIVRTVPLTLEVLMASAPPSNPAITRMDPAARTLRGP